jgi:hypothetical protein
MTDLEDRVADLTFKARALAQAHPLTVTATAYREQMIAEERRTQPMTEFSEWAATAFLVGYCIRRVEEADCGLAPDTSSGSDALVPLGHDAVRFSDEVRGGRPAGTRLLEQELVERLLDRVISTEIEKRVEHWKAQISKADWAMFEEYVAWWVIHGYALRAAEIERVAS